MLTKHRNFLELIQIQICDTILWKHIMDEDTIYSVLSVVGEIPSGKVATYGQIAKLIGRDSNSRLVGRILSCANYYGDYPCHRVVNIWDVLHPAGQSKENCLKMKASGLKKTAVWI